MSLPPQMVDLTGKPNTGHMGGPPIRASTERKMRGLPAVAAGGPVKRRPNVQRSATTRMPTMQAPGPNAPSAYPPQAAAPPSHAAYNQSGYNQWLPTQSMPGAPQTSMIAGYPNTTQMKQQMVMQNVRPAGVANRPGMAYTGQPMQQQAPPQQQQQQQQPQVQGQMPMAYMPDQPSMLMTPSGMPSGASIGNRPGVPTSGKRKLGEAGMGNNDQQPYAAQTKMPLSSSGEIFNQRSIAETTSRSSLFLRIDGTISTESRNAASRQLHATITAAAAATTTTTTNSSSSNVRPRTDVFDTLHEQSNARKSNEVSATGDLHCNRELFLQCDATAVFCVSEHDAESTTNCI